MQAQKSACPSACTSTTVSQHWQHTLSQEVTGYLTCTVRFWSGDLVLYSWTAVDMVQHCRNNKMNFVFGVFIFRLLVWPLFCRIPQSMLSWFQHFWDKELMQISSHLKLESSQGAPFLQPRAFKPPIPGLKLLNLQSRPSFTQSSLVPQKKTEALFPSWHMTDFKSCQISSGP